MLSLMDVVQRLRRWKTFGAFSKNKSPLKTIDKDNKKPSCRETTGLGGGHASHAYSLGHSCKKGAHESRYQPLSTSHLPLRLAIATPQ